MNREIIIHDAVTDINIYRKIKSMIGELGYGPDTKIFIKDNDVRLIVYNEHIIEKIKKALVERKIHSSYAETGD